MVLTEIVELFAEIVRESVPFTIIFWMGEMIVTTLLRVAFSGRISFKV